MKIRRGRGKRRRKIQGQPAKIKESANWQREYKNLDKQDRDFHLAF